MDFADWRDGRLVQWLSDGSPDFGRGLAITDKEACLSAEQKTAALHQPIRRLLAGQSGGPA
jgi:hypothetical protein